MKAAGLSSNRRILYKTIVALMLGMGFASPVLGEQAIDVQRQHLYFNGHTRVACLDLKHGKLLWSISPEKLFPSAGTINIGPVISEAGPVFAGDGLSSTYVLLEPRSGDVKWRIEGMPAWALGSGAGWVYVSGRGVLTALDAKTGQQVWSKEMPPGTNILGGAAPEGSISFYKGRIYTDWRVLSPRTGKVVRYLTWNMNDSIVLENGSLYRITWDNQISRIDPMTFQTLWEVKAFWRPNWNAQGILATDTHVVAVLTNETGFGELRAFDATTGQALWTREVAAPIRTIERFNWDGNVTHDGELLYVSIYDTKKQISIEQALSIKSGERVWSARIPSGQGGLVSHAGVVYAATYDDVLYALSAKTGKILRRIHANRERTH